MLMIAHNVWISLIQWRTICCLQMLVVFARHVHCICICHLKLRLHIIATFFWCQLYCTLLQIVLHFASHESCKLSAGAELEFQAELLQKSLIHVVVVCRNDGVIHVYHQQDLSGGNVLVLFLLFESHSIAVQVFESVVYQPT